MRLGPSKELLQWAVEAIEAKYAVFPTSEDGKKLAQLRSYCNSLSIASDIRELAERCRPAVKAADNKAQRALLAFNAGLTSYPPHYKPIFEDEAERTRKLLDDIDAILEGKKI